MDGLYTNLNKHIVWITPGFASSPEDDTCIPPLIEYLKWIKTHSNITVSIIALQYPFTSAPYEMYGAKVYPLNGKNKWYKKMGIWRKAMKQLQLLHQQQPIDCIHSFWWGETALIGEAFCRGKKIRHICTLMGQDVLSTNRHLKNKRLSKLTTIGLSVFQAEIFKKNTGKKVDGVIHWGIEPGFTESLPKKYDIIGVGSLIPVKNYEMWVEIIAKTKERVPNIKALLVGDGEEKASLQSLIHQYNLEATVQLVGHKTREQTLELIQQSKIFLHTSRHEGFGYVFVEAMHYQLPIVTTPVGYALENEKIWKGTAVEAFAEEIQHILRNKEEKIRYSIPDIETSFEKYLKYYGAG
jgi:1,2-diacylglycerol 3-alpha-glucosyltransferase